MLEQAFAGSDVSACGLPEGFGEFAGCVEGEGEEVEDDEDVGEVFLPWPKLCSRWYPCCLRTLKVSFSIFHRARAHWASLTILSRWTWRLVMKFPR